MLYKDKYFKYKNKYLNLKKQYGGDCVPEPKNDDKEPLTDQKYNVIEKNKHNNLNI